MATGDLHQRARNLVAKFCSGSGSPNLGKDEQSGKGSGIGFECMAIAKSAGAADLLGTSPETQAEVKHWVEVADAIGNEKRDVDVRLQVLNVHLETRSVFAGKGLGITVADLSIFAAVHDIVSEKMYPDLEKVPHLLRWIDYVQSKDEAAQVFPHIPVNNIAKFNPPEPIPQAIKALHLSSVSEKSSATSKVLKVSSAQAAASAVKPEKLTVTKEVVMTVTSEGNTGAQEPKPREKKAPEGQDAKSKEKKEKKEKAPAVMKESDTSFSILNIRVGVIEKVWKHPGADALYVEEIDIGEPNPRQIVSGLAKFLTEEQMLNRKVLVLTNVKVGKVRDVLSAGLVLCASNSDHTQCEPVVPPATAKIGEKVTVEGFEGAPEEVLNPKKKQFEKIQPDLATDASGVACYQGVPFLLGGQPCTSTIVNGIVK